MNQGHLVHKAVISSHHEILSQRLVCKDHESVCLFFSISSNILFEIPGFRSP